MSAAKKYALVYTVKRQDWGIYDTAELPLFDATYYTKAEARAALNEQFDIVFNHEKANEYQPTKNAKDQFHFFVDEEGEKRGFFIARIYANDFRNQSEWKQEAQKRGLISPAEQY